MPMKMITAPAMVSTHPTIDLPLKKRKATPATNGKSERPKALCPQNCQYPLVTVTWFVSSHPPATAIAKPMKNVASPPSVPPAPRMSFMGQGYRPSALCHHYFPLCPLDAFRLPCFPVPRHHTTRHFVTDKERNMT